jgi:tol-pal system protein YbgF
MNYYKLLFCAHVSAAALMATSMAFATASVVDISQTNPQGEQVVVNDQARQGQNTQAQPQQAVQSSSQVIGAPMTTNEPSTTVTLPAQSSLTVSQRLVRVQQQINNLTNMNLPQQINHVQQELAQLRGQLQVQAHDLKLLNNQQRSFYQDLDQRIDQLKNLNSGGGSGSSGDAKSNANEANATSNNIRIKESSAYQAAFNLLRKKQYDKSQVAFQEYLNDYPNGYYISNAHYWLGEIYLAQKNNKQAAQQFQIVVSKFPKTPKIPDAKLKLAAIHANVGKIKLARQELIELKKQHPGSTAAQLANIRLQQLDAMKSNSVTNKSSLG